MLLEPVAANDGGNRAVLEGGGVNGRIRELAVESVLAVFRL